MKFALSNGHVIDYPKGPEDITLAQYIAYMRDVIPTTPKELTEYREAAHELKEIGDELRKYTKQLGTEDEKELRDLIASGNVKDNVKRFLPGLLDRWNVAMERIREVAATMNNQLWQANTLYPYKMKALAVLMGLPVDIKVHEIDYLYQKCTEAIQMRPDTEYKQLYTHNGIVYQLPDKLMAGSTLIEFAEAAQYESALKDMQNGDPEGLLKMCAVLLRPSGVNEYSPEVFEANCAAFQDLPLQVAYEVSFFLNWLSAKYVLSLQRYTLAAANKALN